MKKRYWILAGILALSIAAAGCGKKDDADKEEPATQVTEAPEETSGEDGLVDMEQSSEKEPEIENVMGTKSETASSTIFTNEMGAEISRIYIRPNTEDEDEDTWGSDLIEEAFVLADGQQALYYYEKEGSSGALFDIRIQFTDEDRNECFFRKIPLYTIKEISLCMDGSGEDGIPYATYMTDTGTKEISTLNEVKKRLGLLDSEDETEYDEDEEYNSDEDEEEPTPAPETTGTPGTTGTPEATGTPAPTEAPAEPTETPSGGEYDEPTTGSELAQSYIGKSLDELIAACGSPSGSDYEEEPETGETGYHYYDGYTVSTTIDENGNEVVAGVY